jgi:hypothetical protein
MYYSNPENVTVANALAFAAPFQAKAAVAQENALSAFMGLPASGPGSPVYNALEAGGGPTMAAANALAGGGSAAPASTSAPVNTALTNIKKFDAAGDKNAIANGIKAAAAELGVDPLDLATAISYETAGTFDPTKKGPTTQWGQHRGLIQFGVPQAKQYGVDWSDPINSQLGAEGAVVNYLRGNGVKPGMGLLDIYSTINAGAPGLYHRSDANNGGAPGTVRDKVNNQMAGHRTNAQKLLAAAVAPPAPASPEVAPVPKEDPALLLKRYGL